MYKLLPVTFDIKPSCFVKLPDGPYIPFEPANTDYQTFKKEVLAGAELQDADGNVMSEANSISFVNSLP